MATAKVMLDDVPVTGFHRKLTLLTAGGPFLDGYILGIVGIALALLTPDLHLKPFETGLIGAAALIGVFLGGAVFGYVTDLVGRQLMFTIDLAVFVVGSVLQFFVTNAIELFMLRLVLGVAVGADYPIATALLAEFIPKKARGPLLSTLVAAWWVGYAAAFVVGYILLKTGLNWRVILASSALPSAVVLAARIGTPESPRWLMKKGHVEKAREILSKFTGSTGIEEEPEAANETNYARIFQGDYLRRTVFVSVFWAAQVAPSFAIFTFAPQLLGTLNLKDPYLGTLVMSLFFLVGVIPAIPLVNSWGRRPVLIWPFLITGVALLLLGVVPGLPGWAVVVLFIVFAVFNAGSTVLEWVYPNELFPTEVRATGIGFATAMSRVGAAGGTLALPVMLAHWGVGPSMVVFAAICGIGLLVSIPWAPETRGMSLAECSATCRWPRPAPQPIDGRSRPRDTMC